MKIGVAAEWMYQNSLCRGMVHSEQLVEILKNKSVLANGNHTGTGTLDDPYRKMDLGQWYDLSTKKPAAEATFYVVGSRLIARWGSADDNPLVGYITDVTEHLGMVKKGLGKQEQLARDLGKEFKKADASEKIPVDLPAYARKALRVKDMDDRLLASRCRCMLADSDTDCGDSKELASSFVSLFIAEAHRAPITFIVSLMLLDLIETNTTYGKGKYYSWKSMLMHDNAYDMPHTQEERVVPVPGRSSGVKPLGKHPMAGKDTVVLSAKIATNDNRPNLVRDRIISVASIWFAHYLKKTDADLTGVFILRSMSDNPHGAWSGPRNANLDKSSKAVRNALNKAAQMRCSSTAALIGGTVVPYQDLSGNFV